MPLFMFEDHLSFMIQPFKTIITQSQSSSVQTVQHHLKASLRYVVGQCIGFQSRTALKDVPSSQVLMQSGCKRFLRNDAGRKHAVAAYCFAVLFLFVAWTCFQPSFSNTGCQIMMFFFNDLLKELTNIMDVSITQCLT